jgi:dienelactone hydrolase
MVDQARSYSCAAVAALGALLFIGSACARTPAEPEAQRSQASPTAAVPTDSAGQQIIRPNCVEPNEGKFLHADGEGEPTPVLLLGNGGRGVVVGAQANGGLCQTLPYGRELAAKGYHVAVFSWTRPYAESMAAATRALIADGATKVVLGGFSRGALVGLGIAPSLRPHVVGVFSVSGGPSADEGFPTVASLSGFPGPILLAGSQDDPVFPGTVNRQIAAAHKGPETVLLVPGTDHALSILTGPDGPRVQAAVDRLLAQVLS